MFLYAWAIPSFGLGLLLMLYSLGDHVRRGGCGRDVYWRVDKLRKAPLRRSTYTWSPLVPFKRQAKPKPLLGTLLTWLGMLILPLSHVYIGAYIGTHAVCGGILHCRIRHWQQEDPNQLFELRSPWTSIGRPWTALRDAPSHGCTRDADCALMANCGEPDLVACGFPKAQVAPHLGGICYTGTLSASCEGRGEEEGDLVRGRPLYDVGDRIRLDWGEDPQPKADPDFGPGAEPASWCWKGRLDHRCGLATTGRLKDYRLHEPPACALCESYLSAFAPFPIFVVILVLELALLYGLDYAQRDNCFDRGFRQLSQCRGHRRRWEVFLCFCWFPIILLLFIRQIFKDTSGFLGDLAWKRDALIKKAIEAHGARRMVDTALAGLRGKKAKISLHTETYEMVTEYDGEGSAYQVKKRLSANTEKVQLDACRDASVDVPRSWLGYGPILAHVTFEVKQQTPESQQALAAQLQAFKRKHAGALPNGVKRRFWLTEGIEGLAGSTQVRTLAGGVNHQATHKLCAYGARGIPGLCRWRLARPAALATLQGFPLICYLFSTFAFVHYPLVKKVAVRPPPPQIAAPTDAAAAEEPIAVVEATLIVDKEASAAPVPLSKPPSFGRQLSDRVVQVARQASGGAVSAATGVGGSADPTDLSAMPPLVALRDCFQQELGVEGATLVEVVENAYKVCGPSGGGGGGGGRVGLRERAHVVWVQLGSPPMSRYHEDADEPAAAAAQQSYHEQPAGKHNQQV